MIFLILFLQKYKNNDYKHELNHLESLLYLFKIIYKFYFKKNVFGFLEQKNRL